MIHLHSTTLTTSSHSSYPRRVLSPSVQIYVEIAGIEPVSEIVCTGYDGPHYSFHEDLTDGILG